MNGWDLNKISSLFSVGVAGDRTPPQFYLGLSSFLYHDISPLFGYSGPSTSPFFAFTHPLAGDSGRPIKAVTDFQLVFCTKSGPPRNGITLFDLFDSYFRVSPPCSLTPLVPFTEHFNSFSLTSPPSSVFRASGSFIIAREFPFLVCLPPFSNPGKSPIPCVFEFVR